MNSSRFIGLVISSALALSLSACNTTPTANNGAQLVSGPITALSASSLTVSGKTFSLNGVAKAKPATNVSINGDAAKPAALSVGQHVVTAVVWLQGTGVKVTYTATFKVAR